MKVIAVVATLALSIFTVEACGGGAHRLPSFSRPQEKWSKVEDHDGDGGPSDGGGRRGVFDGDDDSIRFYGHKASSLDALAVTDVIDRYYRSAATDNGAEACLLIAGSLVEGLVEGVGGSSHDEHSMAEECASEMTKMFKKFEHLPGRNPADFAVVKVMEVRMRGDEGLSLLRLPTSEVRDIPVGFEGGTVKMEAFFDSGLG